MITQLHQMNLHTTEEPQPEPVMQLPPAPKLPSLCTLLTAHPRQCLVINQELPAAEPEASPLQQ